ncbi:prolipoprotein diacylglyceryl transferase [Aquicella lusitana]|uniref:Phosphatidylglycerol--prolipoprotein diacylglyceryl transferase n=1 Tax=Aquicella lusitana TaxID=254246 RepID=A0A370GZ77_9COXI|nr:prolipoprotein diacylglyceryl transferase [Aquicella lusitana]RDI48590.1 prolipoprotein diacylglyceryl transferase [Aquicella lusitana]VVC74033.1 Prolipoprotein diacylglyceryl transferase [Aquicella lusitana]
MLTYPNIDPVAFSIGSWPVYWYGLMYLIGFLGGWGLLSLRLRFSPRGFTQDQLSDIVFYAALGAIIGGRLGYMLFYDWRVLFSDPLLIFQTWKGGMSFHGGFLGVIIAMLICAKRMKKSVVALTDLIAPVVPIGLGAGRIGNFINGELWGRVTTLPWGMVFPNGGPYPRHPSQLYEFLLEGVVLFLVLWIYSRKPRPLGAVSGLFALGYGIFRCTAEFFREPDVQIGYWFGWITEGQLLSLPLILLGIILLIWAYKKERASHETIS